MTICAFVFSTRQARTEHQGALSEICSELAQTASAEKVSVAQPAKKKTSLSSFPNFSELFCNTIFSCLDDIHLDYGHNHYKICKSVEFGKAKLSHFVCKKPQVFKNLGCSQV